TPADVLRADALASEIINHVAAEDVVADFARNRNGPAQFPKGDGDIGGAATRAHYKAFRGLQFPGAGKRLDRLCKCVRDQNSRANYIHRRPPSVLEQFPDYRSNPR